MSDSFPPPHKLQPWWKFRTAKALQADRRYYRRFLTGYNANRAAYGLGPVQYPSWLQRHKVMAVVAGPSLALVVLIFAMAFMGVIADPSSTTAAPVPVAAEVSSATPSIESALPRKTAPAAAPKVEDPAAADEARQEAAAAKKDEQERAAEAEKKTETKKKADAAAKKKAGAAAKKQADAAAQKQADADAKKKAAAVEKRAAAKQQRQEAARDLEDTFANCTDMNRTYPHGVGLAGASDSTPGNPVTTFKVSERIYQLNSGRDRDDDGIACEKR